ncbi:MAG: SDR family oxidoreductase [Burkholderiaceae bacterium]
MITSFSHLFNHVDKPVSKWLVTGAGGFIGSHLVQALLNCGQKVVALDNFMTGHRHNLDNVLESVPANTHTNYELIEGDITDQSVAERAMQGVDYVLHQAALGSVPRSLEQPLASFSNNVDGFFKVIIAAKDAGVKRFVYASSSSIYGDHPDLPKLELKTGNPLSPYAATKASNEMFAAMVARCYGMPCAGLRYFNVFGARQDPNGPYAAVIPKWVDALMAGQAVQINGDGQTSRDFCFIDNVVQINLRAALTNAPTNDGISHHAYNVAVGHRTTLNELFNFLKARVAVEFPHAGKAAPVYGDFRPGDVRHSQADISLAAKHLGYEPTHTVEQGLDQAVQWYMKNSSR